MTSLFEDCSNLVYIYATDGAWSTEGLNNQDSAQNIFHNCGKLDGGKGTQSKYIADVNRTVVYAHLDEGTDNPGFLKQAPYGKVVYDSTQQSLRFVYDDIDYLESADSKVKYGDIMVFPIKYSPWEYVYDPSDLDLPIYLGQYVHNS